MSVPLSSVGEGEAAIGFPWGWVVLALILVALGLAVRSEIRLVAQRSDWNDRAQTLYGDGDALGASLRTWAAHQDAATSQTWVDLLSQNDRLVADAERLSDNAPGARQRACMARLAAEATDLRSLILLRTGHTIPSGSAGHTDLMGAALSFDAALLQLRGAL